MRTNHGKPNFVIIDHTTNKTHKYFVIQDLYKMPHTLFKGHDITILKAHSGEDVTSFFVKRNVQ